MIRILFIVTIGVLIGCATSPVSFEKSTPVQSERLGPAYASYSANGPSKGAVIVIRDSGFTGAAVSLPIYVNVKKLANLMPSESVKFYLPEGDNFIGFSLRGLSESYETKNLQEQVLNVVAGNTYYFRLGYIEAGGVKLRRSSQVE